MQNLLLSYEKNASIYFINDLHHLLPIRGMLDHQEVERSLHPAAVVQVPAAQLAGLGLFLLGACVLAGVVVYNISATQVQLLGQ